MGRAVGFLADCLAVARILVEARGVWRDWRGDAAETRSGGRGDRERPDQPKPPGVGGSSGQTGA
jgi:hypothetical protein